MSPKEMSMCLKIHKQPSVEVTLVVYWEQDDGMDFVLGQEFKTKEEFLFRRLHIGSVLSMM